PVGKHRQQHVMEQHAAVRLALYHVEMGQDAARLGGDSGFFMQLAQARLDDGFAEFNVAAGKAPFTDIDAARALGEQDAPVAPDHDDDPDDGALRGGRAHTTPRARSASSSPRSMPRSSRRTS